VLELKKTKRSRISRIFYFFVFGVLFVGWYGTGAASIVLHYLKILRLDENGAGPGIEFAWFMVIIGLFPLREWLGVIFNRVDTVWYSDW